MLSNGGKSNKKYKYNKYFVLLLVLSYSFFGHPSLFLSIFDNIFYGDEFYLEG